MWSSILTICVRRFRQRQGDPLEAIELGLGLGRRLDHGLQIGEPQERKVDRDGAIGEILDGASVAPRLGDEQGRARVDRAHSGIPSRTRCGRSPGSASRSGIVVDEG
ncbi:MAG: hypothetical protein IT385_10740 [Deltaproteobacteria bacterium]|nr:hypothetical protein [Deltaproteobacteria bacterium]